MLREEKKKVKEFIEEQLRKRYIRLLKLPQTLLVLFVEMKNEKRIVQDYQYLNMKMIENYLLPLISDLIDTIDTRKVFTKINLR